MATRRQTYVESKTRDPRDITRSMRVSVSESEQIEQRVAQIAAERKNPHYSVSDYLYEAVFGRPAPPVMVSRKLTAEQEREIAETYAAGGVTQAELARRYGVAQSTVSDIIRA